MKGLTSQSQACLGVVTCQNHHLAEASGSLSVMSGKVFANAAVGADKSDNVKRKILRWVPLQFSVFLKSWQKSESGKTVSPKRQVPFGKTSAILRRIFGHEMFGTQGTATNEATLADKCQSWFGCCSSKRPNWSHILTTSPTLPLG